MDYDKGVYVMTYTGEVSKDGCPVALLQGWKDERLIKEKKLEICGCKEVKGRWKKEQAASRRYGKEGIEITLPVRHIYIRNAAPETVTRDGREKAWDFILLLRRT